MSAGAVWRYAVIVVKDSGKRIYFGQYPSLREAEAQAKGLRKLLPVIVEVVAVPAGRHVVPGMTAPRGRARA